MEGRPSALTGLPGAWGSGSPYVPWPVAPPGDSGHCHALPTERPVASKSCPALHCPGLWEPGLPSAVRYARAPGAQVRGVGHSPCGLSVLWEWG